MSKPKPDKFTAGVTSEKTRQDKHFVQVEGKLIEAQLEAIADGLMKLTILYTSFKEELMSKQKPEKFAATSTLEKPCQDKHFVVELITNSCKSGQPSALRMK